MDKRINVDLEDLKIVLANQCRLAQFNVDSSSKQIQVYKDEIKKLKSMLQFCKQQLEEAQITLLQANVALGNIKKLD